MASEKKFFARIQKFWRPSFGKFNFLILDLVVCIFPQEGREGSGPYISSTSRMQLFLDLRECNVYISGS